MCFVCIVEVEVTVNNTPVVSAVKDAFISNSCRRQGRSVKCMILGPLFTILDFVVRFS